MIEVRIVRRDDLPALLGEGLAGDRLARQLLRSVNEALRCIRDAPRSKPMLCGVCPRRLRNGEYSIVVAWPACDAPTTGFAVGICNKCGPTYEAINEKLPLALARLWPDVRPVRITHPEGGRA